MADPRELGGVATPAAIVDLKRMAANLDRMAAYAEGHGLALRPHTKTHKTPSLGWEQIRRGAKGLTVATGPEAVAMGSVASNLLLAYPVLGGGRLDAIRRLRPSIELDVALDSDRALDTLSAAAEAKGRTVGVLVEVDAGMHRTGVAEAEELVRLARRAESLAGLEFRGIMFYPGHIRQHVEQQATPLAALNELLQLHLDALRTAGLPPAVVSGGSTPTAFQSHLLDGLTEIRPGTYIFNDRTTAAVGGCAWEDCAYSILATVVSTAVAGQAVIDAGSKSLSREEIRAPEGTVIRAADGRVGPAAGLGALLDRPEVTVKATSEEHGLLDLSNTEWRPHVGDRVRVVPNHVCVSVNLQPSLWGVHGDQIVERWPVVAKGWAFEG